MKRLDGTSALFIYSDVPRSYQHTLKIALLDFSQCQGGYRFDDMLALIERNTSVIPFTRWKIARVPFGINHPFWIQDLEFDISHHVRRIACPAPGDRRAFCQLVSELYAQTLSKSMPLWTIWMVEGLEDRRVALVNMLHHAYTDGVGAGLLLQHVTSEDTHSAYNDYTGVDPEKNPGKLRIFVQGAIELPIMFLKEVPALVRDGWRLRKLVKQFKQQGLPRPPDPAHAPPSPLLNAPYSHRRCFYYDSLDLERFKVVAKQLDATVNDLLLAVITGALSTYHDVRNIAIQDQLVATIPINMRTQDEKNKMLGNYAGTSAVSLPINVESPLERLDLVKKSAQTMKTYVKATQGLGLIRAAELLPPVATDILNWAIRKSEGRFSPMGNLAISNVPGPKHTLSFNNQVEVSDWLSIGPVALGIGLNITAWSYVDRFNICLLANPPAVADGAEFFEHVMASFNEYEALARLHEPCRH